MMAIKDVIVELKSQVVHLQSAIQSLESADGGQRSVVKALTKKTVAKVSHMSAAARRAQSARMTKYWAAKRRAKKSK